MTYEPYNGITKEPYTGMKNIQFLIAGAYKINALNEPRWCTFLQAQQNGGRVKKGEHGVKLIYAKSEEEKKFFKGFTVFNFSQIEWSK